MLGRCGRQASRLLPRPASAPRPPSVQWHRMLSTSNSQQSVRNHTATTRKSEKHAANWPYSCSPRLSKKPTPRCTTFSRRLELPLSHPRPMAHPLQEKNRQQHFINLIPSENFTSQAVLDALGSVMQSTSAVVALAGDANSGRQILRGIPRS